jgi:octopine/nopaline transport system permease protein
MEILFGPQGWAKALLTGLALSLTYASMGFVLGNLLGFVIMMAKLGQNRFLRVLGRIYTTLLRGVPALLVIFLLFFGTNGALMAIARGFGYTGYIEVDAFTVGVLAVMLITAAYSSEVLRGAYLSLPKGQFEACKALGLRPVHSHCFVIIPQMMRVALPGLGNVWIMSVKETTLLSVISLAELMRMAGLAGRSTGEPFIFYGAAAVLYLLVIALSSLLLKRLEARLSWS